MASMQETADDNDGVLKEDQYPFIDSEGLISKAASSNKKDEALTVKRQVKIK